MPEVDRHAQAGHQRHQVGVMNPARQRCSGLGRQIHNHMRCRADQGRLFIHAGNVVQTFVIVHYYGGRVVSIKAGE